MAAKKLRIKDIVNGSIATQDSASNKIITNFGELDEVRICGTVLNKFISDDENYANLVIDDGSESIQAKFWRNELNKISHVKVGDILDIVAKISEYNDEKYIQPVSLFNTDIHFWIKFHLEVALSIKKLFDEGDWQEFIPTAPQSTDDMGNVIDEFSNIEKNSNEDMFEEENIIFDDDDINRIVLESISKESMSKEDIILNTNLDEIDVMLSLKELLENGDIFEVDGKYKKL